MKIGISLAHAFSKSVKDKPIDNIDHQIISDFVHINKLCEIVEKLEQLHGAQIVRLDEVDLGSNPKEWITSLLIKYHESVDIKIMEYILRDFTEDMKTRMREDTKYVIGLLIENKLVLCHSVFGGETITPNWEVIPRMLDTDNVLRYVSFTGSEGNIKLTFWEKEATSSFTEWLGLRGKKGFQYGGYYRIRSEIEGMKAELQLNEEEVDILIKDHSEFRRGKITLSNPINVLNIEKIKMGNRQFDNSEDFLQVYKALKFGVIPYVDKYQEIMKKPLPMLVKFIDDETQVMSVENGQSTIRVEKKLHEIDILFVNEQIEIKPDYIRKLASRFLNNEVLRVFHAGCDFSFQPFKLGSMELYNKLDIDGLCQSLTNWYDQIKLQDRDLDCIVKYMMLDLLSKNIKSPIMHFLMRLANEVISSITLSTTQWTKWEDEVIEYKSVDCLAGDNREVIKGLSTDMTIKLNGNPFKVYIIGVESNGQLNPIPLRRLNDERVEVICAGLRDSLPNATILPCRTTIGDRCLLLLGIANKSRQSI